MQIATLPSPWIWISSSTWVKTIEQFWLTVVKLPPGIEMHDQTLRILLIEDNPGDARLIREMLRDAGTPDLEMELENRLSSGLSRLQQGGIAAVLLDLELPDASGLETLARVYSQFPEIPIVVLTAKETRPWRPMR